MPGAPGSKPLPSTAQLATGGAGPPHPPPPPARARRCARQLKLNSGIVKTRGALNFAVIETKTEPGHCLPGRGQQARPPGGFPAPSSTASPTGSSPIPPSGSSDAASLIWHENKSGSFHPSVPGQCHLRGQLCPGRPCGGQDAPGRDPGGNDRRDGSGSCRSTRREDQQLQRPLRRPRLRCGPAATCVQKCKVKTFL